MNRLYDLIWNLAPLAASLGAAAMRICVDPPSASLLSSYGFDFGLAAIFAFSCGRHIHRIRQFKYRWRASLAAAIGVGVLATVTEIGGVFPMSTFDPFDIVAYWTGVAYALAGLRFLPSGSSRGQLEYMIRSRDRDIY